MWKITTESDGTPVYALGLGETFEELTDEGTSIVFESANYMKRRVELELAERVDEICRLARSLTAEEWSALPKKVRDFLLPYIEVEEDDDED